MTQRVAAREDRGVPAAALTYDREDAARAPAAGEGKQGDGGGLPVPDEVGEEGHHCVSGPVLHRPRVHRALGRTTGVVLIGFGLAVAGTAG
ncbi:hypothetical protein [Streptomyces massasporeus]|uniref:hypothetical protein n=1 Tax=Streptomyces massasporeus TaxID=67324 RepID=UPI0033C8BCE0